jgi:hypothetical protein
MPADVGTALALVNQRFGIEDKEPGLRIDVARLI